ncbi:MAG: hypothetical protein H0V14_01340 [Chitinophagaceae bacterium]|nr:hypothetical protein [Chitinophagaceae bacterium]
MTDTLLNRTITYSGLSTSEYLKSFEKEIQKNITLEALTIHLTADNNYHTEKPYLYRRIIKSTDRRFEGFEIVHDKSEKIHVIVFDLKITLSELENLFGKPFMQNEPYDEATAFAFKSTNPDIEIIKTRHPKWLTKIKDKLYEYSVDNNSYKLVDPEFSFVQFSIKQ